jgi:hypothetical protein
MPSLGGVSAVSAGASRQVDGSFSDGNILSKSSSLSTGRLFSRAGEPRRFVCSDGGAAVGGAGDGGAGDLSGMRSVGDGDGLLSVPLKPLAKTQLPISVRTSSGIPMKCTPAAFLDSATQIIRAWASTVRFMPGISKTRRGTNFPRIGSAAVSAIPVSLILEMMPPLLSPMVTYVSAVRLRRACDRRSLGVPLEVFIDCCENIRMPILPSIFAPSPDCRLLAARLVNWVFVD